MIYLKLIWAYIKIGIFGFGGGYAMLSLVEHSVVDPGWISETMFTDIVAISQMTPGPIGINSATYIGYAAPASVAPDMFASPLWGILGSIACTLAVVIPSYLMVLYAAHFIAAHKQNGTINAIFKGLRPVTVGLIASAAILLMNEANFNPRHHTADLIINIAICTAAFLLVYFPLPLSHRKYKLHPIIVIIMAGVAGYLIYGL